MLVRGTLDTILRRWRRLPTKSHRPGWVRFDDACGLRLFRLDGSVRAKLCLRDVSVGVWRGAGWGHGQCRCASRTRELNDCRYVRGTFCSERIRGAVFRVLAWRLLGSRALSCAMASETVCTSIQCAFNKLPYARRSG